MIINALSTLILLATLFIGYFVLHKNYKNKINRIFALFVLSTAFWIFSNLMIDLSRSQDILLFWSRLVIVGAIFMPLFFWKFSVIFPNFFQRRTLKYLIIEILAWLSAIVLLVFVPTKYNVSEARYMAGDVPIVVSGSLYIFFSVYLGILMFLGFTNLFKKYKISSGAQKLQIKHVLIGVAISSLGAAITNLIFLFLNLSKFSNIGPLFIIFFIGFTTYAITRYRFMGVKIIINNLIFFTILLLFILAANYLTIFTHNYVSHSFGESNYLYFGVNFAVAFLTVLLFIPFYRYTKHFSEVLVYRHRDPRQLAQTAALKLSQIIDHEELARETTLFFRQVLDTEQVAVFHYDSRSRKVTKLINQENFNQFFREINHDFLIETINQEKMIIRDEICSDPNQANPIFETEISIILPIKAVDTLNLIFLLGPKVGGGFYGKEDFEFIEKIQPHLTRALINSAKLKKVNDRNTELEKTQEQFLSLAGYNLRLPACQIEGVAGLGIKEPETSLDRLRACQGYVRKISEVMDNLLLAGEIKDGKLSMETRPTNLTKVLAEVIAKKEPMAKEKNLDFKLKTLSKEDIYIESERSILEQLFLNLIDNALSYTTIGSVTVKLEKIDRHAIIKIIDTGIGLDRKDRRKLFQKFFKGRNNYNRDGLGLGLYLAKKIIDFHPGAEIGIEDGPGVRGTMVTLRFLGVEKGER